MIKLKINFRRRWHMRSINWMLAFMDLLAGDTATTHSFVTFFTAKANFSDGTPMFVAVNGNRLAYNPEKYEP